MQPFMSCSRVCSCSLYFYFNRDDLVLVDDTAWESLQIFSSELHSMGAKRTRYCKEGLSLYNHLNRCRTAQGTKFLRLMLSRPVRNVNVLKRRHDVIEYCCHPTNMDFVKSASECLKGTKNLPVSIFRLGLFPCHKIPKCVRSRLFPLRLCSPKLLSFIRQQRTGENCTKRYTSVLHLLK